MTVCFTPAEVLAATTGQCLAEGLVQSFIGVSTDTRTLLPGSIYVALSGEKFDGHDFLKDAVRKGAACLVVSREIDVAQEGVAVFLVEDTRIAFQALARFHRLRFGIPVIAVTGSNGKTSTKDMIAAVLGASLRILKTEANFNNEIGLSQTLLRIEAGHQAVVVEMGMRGRGQIAELAAIARPTVGVVTNVGETHLELLGTVENIAAAKAELLEALDENSVAVLNADDLFVSRMANKTPARIVTFGLKNKADVTAKKLEQGNNGVSFECCAGGRSFPLSVACPGVHNVCNALAAVAVGLEMGLKPESISLGLARYEPGKMRLNIRQYESITVIDDTYNASPLSMAAAIEVLAGVSKGRKIAAIGDMLELGPAAQAAHVKVGEQLAAAGVEWVLTLGALAEVAGKSAIQHGVSRVVGCSDHQAAVNELKKQLLPGDTLLIKGSRGMQMEKLLAVFATSSEG